MAATPELLRLDTDMIEYIASTLGELGDANRDLNAFAMTCRALYHIINPYLYAQDIRKPQSAAVRIAAVDGRLDTLEHILDSEACFEIGWALFWTIAGNQLAVVNRLLAKLQSDPDPYQGNIHKFGSSLKDTLLQPHSTYGARSPVFQAVFEGRDDIARVLIEAEGATVTITSSFASSLLSEAVMNENSNMAEFIIAKGGMVAKGTPAQRLLSVAIGQNNKTMARLLLRHGAKANYKDPRSGLSPMHMTIIAWSSADIDSPLGMTEILIENGADGEDIEWVLLKAAAGGHLSFARRLLQRHPHVLRSWSNDAESPLMAAACAGQNEMVKLLTQHGADVAFRGKIPCNFTEEGSVLSQASIKCSKEVLELLLHKLTKAPETKRQKAFMRTEALVVAIRHGSVETVRLLLNNGADATGKAMLEPGWPIRTASWNGRIKTCKLLLARGADVESADAHRETLLHIAADTDNLKLGEVLLALGARIDAVNTRGMTPLHLAVCYKSTRMAKFLVRAGADTTIREEAGFFTPLQIAKECQNQEMVKLLLGEYLRTK